MSGQQQIPELKLGLAMWSHNQWQQSLYGKGTPQAERLARYAEVFNTVEGNTSFYATPSANSVSNWRDAVGEDFRFTFKLPQEITHKLQLRHCDDELEQFLQVMSPLFAKTGLWKIQLPGYFGPEALGSLDAFLGKLPTELPLGVEVRHPAFFAKGEAERQLNRLLLQRSVNRIIMDTRPVFAAPPNSAAVIDAHEKKPKVPVHAIATGRYPTVRFIGHPELEANQGFFKPWLDKLCQWLEEERQPYLFIHTPDNAQAPELAISLQRLLSARWQAKHGQPLQAFLLAEQADSQNQQLGLAL